MYFVPALFKISYNTRQNGPGVGTHQGKIQSHVNLAYTEGLGLLVASLPVSLIDFIEPLVPNIQMTLPPTQPYIIIIIYMLNTNFNI